VSSIDDFVWKSNLHALRFSRLTLGPPVKEAAIVACMDARLCLESLLGLRPGDAHVMRNAGGIVTDDVLRSLLISQRLLGTREVMLIHHTDCGMMTFSDAALSSEIESQVGVRLPFQLGAFTDLDDNVRHSMERVRTCPFLPFRDAVRGFVYQVDSGRLREITPA
jgi:carbonic anhydrase